MNPLERLSDRRLWVWAFLGPTLTCAPFLLLIILFTSSNYWHGVIFWQIVGVMSWFYLVKPRLKRVIPILERRHPSTRGQSAF